MVSDYAAAWRMAGIAAAKDEGGVGGVPSLARTNSFQVDGYMDRNRPNHSDLPQHPFTHNTTPSCSLPFSTWTWRPPLSARSSCEPWSFASAARQSHPPPRECQPTSLRGVRKSPSFDTSRTNLLLTALLCQLLLSLCTLGGAQLGQRGLLSLALLLLPLSLALLSLLHHVQTHPTIHRKGTCVRD